MADELGLDARFTAETADFERRLNRLIDDVNQLNTSIGGTDKGLDKFERQLARAGAGLTAAATGTEKASTAQKTLNKSLADTESNLTRQRYALYDVASTYGILSAALLATAGYAVKVGADFESAFTGVERTLEDGQSVAAIAAIRDELIDLSTTIPKTFAELSEIATLGNQLGVAAEDLTKFTETVAQFSTVTGITADQSAQAFGRIGNILNILPEDYDKLGSAITYVGRNSAATEKQIITLTERLGASASRAGLTADEVVGLSGALAGLAVAPERAQGVFETYFNTLNKAVAEGGDSLNNFAILAGRSNAEISSMVQSGQGLPLLIDILGNIESKNTVEVTAALQSLGLTGLRVNEVLPRLSGGIDQLEEALANSSKAYEEGSELSSQYAKIADDLNTQLQLLVNSVNALIEELSGGLVPGIAGAVGQLADFVNSLREIASNPAAQALAGLAVGFAVVAGAITAYRAASALAIASTYALTTAQAGLAASGARLGITGFIQALYGLNAANVTATASTTTLTGATTALGTALRLLPWVAVGAAAVGALAYITTATQSTVTEIDTLSNRLDEIAQKADTINVFADGTSTDGMDAVNAELEKYLNYLEQAADKQENLNRVRESGDALDLAEVADSEDAVYEVEKLDAALARLVETGRGASASRIYDEIQAKVAATGDEALIATAKFYQYRAAVFNNGPTISNVVDEGLVTRFAGAAKASEQLSSGLQKTGRSAGGAAPKLRTLVDYANDLSSVFGRAFDIRFGAQLAIDDVTSSFSDLTDRINDSRIALQQLTADRAVKEYFLSIAEAYDDQLRAGVLRGELAELNQQIAETQADASTELTGNSKAAINNRKVLTGLVKEYEEYITALAAGGADQATLNTAVANSRASFLAQAQALGFSNQQLQPYIASFSDLTKVINNIPRNINVAFNGDAALQAVNEFLARARAAAGSGISVPISVSGNLSPTAKDALFTQWATLEQQRAGRALAQNATGWAIVRQQWENGVYGRPYWDGGFTGRGGKYQAAGVVHRGEYVVPKEQVNQRTGLPYANAFGKMQAGTPASGNSYASGGFVSGMGGVMDFGAWERRIMNKIAENTGKPVMLGFTPITNAVNSTNRSAYNRGAA